jgi:hypothetical protein
LDAESRALFWRAVRLLPWVALSLRFRGYARTEVSLHSRAAVQPDRVIPEQEVAPAVAKTARMVRSASHFGPFRATCLAQSLTLWLLLQRQNISSSIKIGVRKTADRLQAHAWVERDGIAVNESDAVHEHYVPFEREFANIPSEPS